VPCTALAGAVTAYPEAVPTALVALGLLLASAAPQQPSAAPSPQELRFRETVEVERFVVEVRAVSDAGDAILGLRPADFRVEVDGRRVDVESAFWVTEAPQLDDAGPLVVVPDAPPLHGRSIVFLFQKSLQASRAVGFLEMRQEAASLLHRLHPEDRVAVVSFDSRLRMWQDFTTDRVRLSNALDRLLAGGPERWSASADESSLAAHLDRQAARGASSIERALALLGEALAPLPGAKSLAFFGWGFGRFSGSGVEMEPDYDEAREALKAARVSVFCLDVTNADYHSLEEGLRELAEDTGGFYARTHLFRGQAMRRLEGALAGYYVLSFRRPEGARAPFDLDVKLVGRSGEVLVRETY
jgi:VWFA-related protein